jgi:hypothetical protein
VHSPSMLGESRSVGPGLATSLPTVCAAPVPRAVGQRLTTASDTRRRLYGGWCWIKSWRPQNSSRKARLRLSPFCVADRRDLPVGQACPAALAGMPPVAGGKIMCPLSSEAAWGAGGVSAPAPQAVSVVGKASRALIRIVRRSVNGRSSAGCAYRLACCCAGFVDSRACAHFASASRFAQRASP